VPACVPSQVTLTAVILSSSWDLPCDKPLRWFVACFTARALFTLPLTFYR
jgi:hypothetical protein